MPTVMLIRLHICLVTCSQSIIGKEMELQLTSVTLMTEILNNAQEQTVMHTEDYRPKQFLVERVRSGMSILLTSCNLNTKIKALEIQKG
jgi:hypothetical protein